MGRGVCVCVCVSCHQDEGQTVPFRMQGRWRQESGTMMGQKGTQPPPLHWEGFGKVSEDADVQLRVDLPGFRRK